MGKNYLMILNSMKEKDKKEEKMKNLGKEEIVI